MDSFSSLTRISGLNSGMDTESLVKKLMDAEAIRYNKMKQEQQKLTWQSDAYRQWNTDLFSFRSNVLFDMKLSKNYNTFSTTSSSTDAVVATANPDAIEGNHTIRANQLAEGATFKVTGLKIDTTKTLGETLPLIESDTLTVSTKDSEGTLRTAKISVKTTGKIGDLINALNSAKDDTGKSLGIQAVYDSNLQQLIIKTKATGANTELKIEAGNSNTLSALKLDANANGVNGRKLKADNTVDTNPSGAINVDATANSVSIIGTDASITSDGVTIKQSSNSVTLLGINYTIKKSGIDVNINVARDYDAAVKNIKDFVNKYNEMIDKIYKTVSERVYRDYQPLTDDQRKAMSEDQIKKWEEKAKSGLLRNDNILSTLYNKMRSDVFSTVDNGSSYNNLASIGIKSNGYQDRGKLTVDEKKLREALQADPEAVRNLFTQSGNTWKSTTPIEPTAKLGLSTLKFSIGTSSYTVPDINSDSTIKDVVDKINTYAQGNNLSVQASYDEVTKSFTLSTNAGQELQITEGASALGNAQDVSAVKKGIINRLYDGFQQAFQDIVKKAGLSTNDKDDESIVGKLLKDVNRKILNEERRLRDVEDSYYRKFTAMEKALGKYNSQSSWLMQQFGGGR